MTDRDERLHALLYSCESRDELCERLVAMEDKLAGLRELARTMAYCMQDSNDCDKCSMNGARMRLEIDPLFACDGLCDKMRELGVEVDR